ncbi:MAG: phosphopantothenoylcysteine decarboxylase, partial [Acidimicrobiales bacterium]
ERATAKLAAKGADIIVGNDVTATGAGFSHDTNQVTIVTASSRLDLPLCHKSEVANAVLDVAVAELRKRS